VSRKQTHPAYRVMGHYNIYMSVSALVSAPNIAKLDMFQQDRRATFMIHLYPVTPLGHKSGPALSSGSGLGFGRPEPAKAHKPGL
jgi:hypothetical protein